MLEKKKVKKMFHGNLTKEEVDYIEKSKTFKILSRELPHYKYSFFTTVKFYINSKNYTDEKIKNKYKSFDPELIVDFSSTVKCKDLYEFIDKMERKIINFDSAVLWEHLIVDKLLLEKSDPFNISDETFVTMMDEIVDAANDIMYSY